MTQVIFDVVDLVGEVHPGDTVSVWPPYVASTVDGRVQSTRKIDVLVDEGPVTREMEPGPLVVQLRCRGIADTKPRTVTIPDEGIITLANLLQSTFTYTPAVVSQVARDAAEAREAADRVGTAEQVGEWASDAQAEANRAKDEADRAESATSSKVDQGDVTFNMVTGKIVQRELDSPNIRVSESPQQPYHAASTSWVRGNAAAIDSVPLRVDDFGAVADGTTDNTDAFNQACDAARSEKRPLRVPAGQWKINGTVDISGISIFGDVMGYQGGSGAVLVGNGENTALKQESFDLTSLTMSISGLRIENVETGIDLGYMVQTAVTDVWIHSTGTGIKFGANSSVGPLWCMFSRVVADSTGGYGMVMEGSQWCNANVFDTCEFKGGAGFAGVKIEGTGGYGAVKNSFRNCEFAGNGAGVLLAGTTRSTTFSDCYMESQGPSIVSRGLTIDLHLTANTYGSTKNDTEFGPRFIDHQTGNMHVRVNGGWLVTGDDPRQAGVHFIGSDNPSNLELIYLVPPHTSASSEGFMLHDPGTIKTAHGLTQTAVASTDSRIDVRRSGNLVRFRSSASVPDTAVSGWTLPAWARPSATFGGPSLNQGGEIYIGTDGKITLAGGLAGKSFRFDLTYLI